MNHPNSFHARQALSVGGQDYEFYSLKMAEENGLSGIGRLPFSLKIVLENLLRHEDGGSVTRADIEAVAAWLNERRSQQEIAYRPSRVLMQDFTGVPAVADLAAMRDALAKRGGDPQKINPLVPVDLVIDHSVMVDRSGTPEAMAQNIKREYERNGERYAFLRWASDAFSNFRVVPPGAGICHQVNLEHLARVVWTKKEADKMMAYPDTLVGTDSHTTMINALGVLGWGVGGIEAEAALLGQPISMLLPEVMGVQLRGKAMAGVTATDIVLTVTEMLRKRNVVGKFVEFFGEGMAQMALEDRATIANMAPEYGATCGFFPVDEKTLDYLRATGREDSQVDLVKAYLEAQGLFYNAEAPAPMFTDILEIDLNEVRPSLAGPRRPQDKVVLTQAVENFRAFLTETKISEQAAGQRYKVANRDHDLGHGDIVIAAITSCTNTSNPRVMLGAGLIARAALEKGLTVKPWVKTSLAPGSQVVADYLAKSGLQNDLDSLGFNIVGFGCTTCIGNSGPLAEDISAAIKDNDLTVAAVLSGNRNFEGRIHAEVQANYLASPMLVVAYALAGSMRVDLAGDALGQDADGAPVYLKDLWPSDDEITKIVQANITSDMFRTRYGDLFKGDEAWSRIKPDQGDVYKWFEASTYIRKPPFFEGQATGSGRISGAKILALLGDSITTDHISPAGSIAAGSPAAQYLEERQITRREFNSYGARRGNHEVMARGTFANIRLRNQIVPSSEGGITKTFPEGKQMTIYDAAQNYMNDQTPLVVFAGREYGTGSSRDWAAKGPRLLGVKAVIAQSFERIHRSNLIGMGILPLQFEEGVDWRTLGLTGAEDITIDAPEQITPRQKIGAAITFADGTQKKITLICRIDTGDEVSYHKAGGILPFVLEGIASS